MPDDILPFDKTRDTGLSRRTFTALSFGAGAIVAAPAMAADKAVIETDVTIKMAGWRLRRRAVSSVRQRQPGLVR